MRNLLIYIVPSLLIVFSMLSCELGEQPFGPNISVKNNADTAKENVAAWESGIMRLHVNPLKISAGYKHSATIKVTLVDTNKTPIKGQRVYFRATHGFVGSSVTTDSSGTAVVSFTSEPINADAVIFAWIYVVNANNDTTKVSVSQTVTLSGVTIKIISNASQAMINTLVPVTISVTDADGEPVRNALVYISGSVAPDTLVTQSSGNIYATVTSDIAGPVIVNVSSLGASATITIVFLSDVPNNRKEDKTKMNYLTGYLNKG